MFTSTHKISGGTLTGRFVQHKLASERLGEERIVTVRLPDNYTPSKNYPVVYLQDGQNMFDRRRGFGGQEWQVDETFARLTAQGRVPESLLVAVDNGGAKRLDEYTHVPDAKHGGGRGEDYEKFFLEELLPTVESTYSVDTNKRLVMGSSLGGLVSLNMALNHPGSFAAVGALSPSVWWADGNLSTQTLSRDIGDIKPRIWLDMGTEEGRTDEYGTREISDGEFGARPVGANDLQDVRDRSREMGEALLETGWGLDDDLRYHEPEGGRHNESSWASRVGEVVEWLMEPFDD